MGIRDAGTRIWTRIGYYWVQILTGDLPGWTHVHGPQWEVTGDPRAAWAYADQVQRDYPDSEVRVMWSGEMRDQYGQVSTWLGPRPIPRPGT